MKHIEFPPNLINGKRPINGLTNGCDLDKFLLTKPLTGVPDDYCAKYVVVLKNPPAGNVNFLNKKELLNHVFDDFDGDHFIGFVSEYKSRRVLKFSYFTFGGRLRIFRRFADAQRCAEVVKKTLGICDTVGVGYVVVNKIKS